MFIVESIAKIRKMARQLEQLPKSLIYQKILLQNYILLVNEELIDEDQNEVLGVRYKIN
ncbi:MAG: hypothetical protein ACEY3C_01770 [Candidatus Tisiphia sp.]